MLAGLAGASALLLPQLEWKVPCGLSTHPGSSSRSGCSAKEPLTQLAHPSGTLEPCAITASARDRRGIPLQGLQWSFLLQRTHKPSNSHCFSALPGVILLVSQSFRLLSYFYLPAFTSGWGAGTWAAPSIILLLHHSSLVCYGEMSALPGNAHCWENLTSSLSFSFLTSGSLSYHLLRLWTNSLPSFILLPWRYL